MSIMIRSYIFITTVFYFAGCTTSKMPAAPLQIKLLTLDPGHFHAALVQKSMYPEVDSTVYVYAENPKQVDAHLQLIGKYNAAPNNPTTWKEEVYTGTDYLEKMIGDKKGNVVVISGNNKKKTEYIKRSLESGINVLADKPLAINTAGFKMLEDAFSIAAQRNLVLYDIMTERFEITNLLQKELAALPEVFGLLLQGTENEPAIIKESVHHFYKQVSGQPLIRPVWFFDVEQQGNGIVDVTTHLVDLVQWQCFPEASLNYKNDIDVLNAERTPTLLDGQEFKTVTNSDTFPHFLKKDLKDGILNIYSNGNINYRIKGVHAKVSVKWNYQAPTGTGDTHFSMIRGSKSDLVIRQGKEQNFRPVLYIEPTTAADTTSYPTLLQENIGNLARQYPGIKIKRSGNVWEVLIPEKYKTGHEAHFAEVTRKYIGYVLHGGMPVWEVPNMIAKYYTTTSALEKSVNK